MCVLYACLIILNETESTIYLASKEENRFNIKRNRSLRWKSHLYIFTIRYTVKSENSNHAYEQWFQTVLTQHVVDFIFIIFQKKICFKTVLYYIARSEAVGTGRDHYVFMTSALNLFMMYLCFSIVRICYNKIEKSKRYHYYIVYLYGFTDSELFKMNMQCNKDLRIKIVKYHSVDVIQNEEQN